MAMRCNKANDKNWNGLIVSTWTSSREAPWRAAQSFGQVVQVLFVFFQKLCGWLIVVLCGNVSSGFQPPLLSSLRHSFSFPLRSLRPLFKTRFHTVQRPHPENTSPGVTFTSQSPPFTLPYPTSSQAIITTNI